MNKKVLRSLEYDKIIDRLTEYADSALGKDQCRKLVPMSSLEEIETAQSETADALTRVMKNGKLFFSGLRDTRPSIMHLEIGGTLGMGELLAVSRCLDIAAKAKSYGRTNVSEEAEPDSIQNDFDALEPLTPLNQEIKRCIVSEEEVSDEASPALRKVRQAIKNTNSKVHTTLNQILNSSRTMLQDGIITMRSGRYCLPIKMEYRSSFPGMIHDQSSSGSTVFIEPMAVVKLNNDLAELASKEQEEIQKVLEELSAKAALETENLKINVETLARLDFIFAKAALARALKATKPEFNTRGFIHLKKARHPLIDPKKVVPIDIKLGQDFTLLIITGPNTGGKTVSLKTTGLFTLLGQAGLHIPAFDHSELAVFEEVYADIGDEQSIEQSLSTFSSHMVNTVSILKRANRKSLVLFDELGAGTDPTEGAALAISILSFLKKRGVRTMATTHYSEIKVYALSTEGVENACCEFDVETLSPTYRLLIGIPGKSNAFAISRKLGLSDEIIEDAKTHIETGAQNFEDLLAELEKNRIIMEQERAQISAYKEEIEALNTKLKSKQERLEQSRERLLREANEKARDIIQEAKDYADETIKKYNKWSREGVSKEMEQERNALNKRLGSAQEKLAIGASRKPGSLKPSDLRLGDSVRVLSLNLNGTVSTLPNAKGDLYVQMGILRSQVNIKDLELINEPAVTGPGVGKTGGGKIKMSKSATISPDINLIGKTTDEAIPLLDKYLDDAYLAHMPQVTIIHGRGTGALKNAVHNHLKKTSYVKSFRLGEFGEGSTGVTVVVFK
ncbi:endonuclease MutS2 [Anaerolentibacter hominis]|uniref:endonuclease MutS2 n=1 Tax=Anaerolentibacter hominis TaxID=3079009 RepID=UPI0031B83399